MTLITAHGSNISSSFQADQQPSQFPGPDDWSRFPCSLMSTAFDSAGCSFLLKVPLPATITPCAILLVPAAGKCSPGQFLPPSFSALVSPIAPYLYFSQNALSTLSHPPCAPARSSPALPTACGQLLLPNTPD